MCRLGGHPGGLVALPSPVLYNSSEPGYRRINIWLGLLPQRRVLAPWPVTMSAISAVDGAMGYCVKALICRCMQLWRRFA
ncbi:hypothetical protein KCP73_25335 [Salmonella enterica subsp. enterica]|nr:hypothetical protein KCP73_25335 [Salmonella enterica subsp. enterica]